VVVGLTASTNLPGTTGALQPAHSGGLDGFVTRIGTCPVTVGTTSSFFPATAGSYQLAVITDANCGWQATSDVSWVAINPASGTGNGSISYTLEANSGPLRVGHVTVNGATLTLQQVSGACLHLNSPGSWFPDAGGPFMLNVFATCPWTASSNRSWIYLDNTAGSGNGSILYYIYPNLTGAARFGEINVSGYIFSVSQTASAGTVSCLYELSSATEQFGRSGGSASVLVSAGSGCEWTTTNTYSWISITAGIAGSGEGVVGISVSPNATGQNRIGQLAIAGHALVITQTSD
jgi:hypothetical protein